MTRYLLGRSLLAILTLFGMVTLAFFMLRALPGDPALAILGEHASQSSVTDLRASLGLDEPLLTQYLDFLRGFITGDLGTSAITRRPALGEVSSAIGPSLALAVGSVAIAIVIGLPLGVVSAVRQGSAWDYGMMIVTVGGISLPSFWVGLMAILLFAHWLQLFPSIGAGTPGDLLSQVRALVLPAAVLSTSAAAYIARLTRSSMLEVLRQDYILVAKAMGLRRRRIVYVHALRNALLPILGVVAVSFALAIGNSVLVEIVFSRPGVGTTLINATFARDYQVVQAGFLVLAVIVVGANFLLDLIYPVVDPRLRR